MNTARCLHLAGEWFVRSGIQDTFGGVARYYRSDLRENAAVSTEITGYTASALVNLHARTGCREYREAALRAGRFLTGTAWDPAAGTFPFEVGWNGGGPRAYFFDCGIIVRALIALWRAEGDAELLRVATACGEAMVRDFASESDFHPVIALPSKEPAAREACWSRAPGCYQLKAALGWRELAEAGCGTQFEAAYERMLAYALADEAAFLTRENGRERVMDRLHAYCYFLEGLLPCAARLECAAALGAGIARAGRLLREIAPLFARSDVYAQLLRLRLFAYRLGAAPLDRAAAKEEAAAIPAFQLEHDDGRVHGGFSFGRKGAELLPHINPVSTAFCVQALEMWRAYKAGEFEPDWRMLI